ncbi:MAG: DUF4214 domain-containing protein, partial [Oscillospiraceae bacterium]|nr:DUF4214 domain-containing protein [Oscillospiraceae bacterium]
MKIRKQVISIAIIFALSFSAVFTQAFANGESTAPDPVEQFVTRLYELVLQRAPDLEGLNAWSNQLRTNRLTGSRVAYEFFFSPEMKGRNLSDSAFVDVLYNTLLNRAPDASGKNNWTGQLSDGMPRENIFAGFVNSVEFADICNSYGITRGTYEPPPGALSRVFVARLYRTILLRTPDSNGLDGWQNALNNGIVTGAEVAYGFFYSGEMFSKSVNMNDDQFVEILYNSLLGRASDPSGKAYWINQLRSGISRYSLFV